MEKYKFIKKKFLDVNRIREIKQLQEFCFHHEKINMKLELEYKYKDALAKKFHNEDAPNNEFYCYYKSELVGYLSIMRFLGATPEINGMVHPKHRKRGIFSVLFGMVMDELKAQNIHTALLLCDHKSPDGKTFIDKQKGTIDHIEFEMILPADMVNLDVQYNEDVVLKRANFGDEAEINKQNKMFEKESEVVTIDDSDDLFSIEDEEKRGFFIYMIMLKDEVIGKIHLSVDNTIGWIYGFYIYPRHRGFGYGKAALYKAIHKLLKRNVKNVMLQVDSINDIALNVYKQMGFTSTYAMEYHKIEF